MERSFERDIIPMARSEGLALAPWNVLAGGKLRTDEEEEKRRQTGEKGRTITNPNWERNDQEKAMSKALEKVASEVGAKHITSGQFYFLQFLSQLTLIAYSGHRLRYAQGALRFPHHRWSQG